MPDDKEQKDCSMSKITINAVLTLLRLVIVIVSKAVRVIYAITDLVDDGCLNSSSPRPDWMQVLLRALNSLQSLGSELTSIEDDVYHESIGTSKSE